MRKSYVLLKFLKLGIASKIEFYKNVIAKIKANSATFPNPDVAIVLLEQLVNDLEAKNILALDGGHTAIVARNVAETAADEAFKEMANYVDRIAKGDELIIALSGFESSKQPTTYKKPELAAENGTNSGWVHLVAKAVPGAGSYIWQMATGAIPTNPNDWATVGNTTQATLDHGPIEIATIAFFRVAAVTKMGTTDYTSPVMKVVE
jgi:hypothetical protein